MGTEDKARNSYLKQQLANQKENTTVLVSRIEGKKSQSQSNKSNEWRLNTPSSTLNPSVTTISTASIYAGSVQNVDSMVIASAPRDLESIVRWLSMIRQYHLVDRMSKTQYYFAVTKELSLSDKKANKYSFTWRDRMQSPLSVGSVPIAIVCRVSVSTQDPYTFVLSLEETPSSLRLSGGRTSVSVKCTTEAECLKYVASLEILRKQG